MFYSLNCSIVEINMGEPETGRSRYFISYTTPDCEAVILRGDLDCLLFKELYWMITAVVPERKLEGARPKCAADELMT
jgi:hypothetical protein